MPRFLFRNPYIRITRRILAVLCLASTLSFAGTWTGLLVDSRCYAAAERNANPTDTLTSVDRDGYSEVRRCSPKPKTKSFAVVPPGGPSCKLDPEGNAKAAELVRMTGKKSLYRVTVTGEMNKNAVKVDSIEAATR
jgi:hypothetical protein